MHPAQIELRKYATASNKKTNEWFFKTGPGQYGHGDQFIGVKVPEIRKTAKKFQDLELKDLKVLLESPVHEDRLLALLILRPKYETAVKKNDSREQKIIFDFFFKNKKRVNNWDLVDQSAPYVSGHFAYHHPAIRKKLFALATSSSMWDRRIAILSTFYFIRKNRFQETLILTKKLLNDPEDLMHKACGWMLRELGKRDLKTMLEFIENYGTRMPRTMLRYSIEKLPTQQRLHYLNQTRKTEIKEPNKRKAARFV